MIYLALWLYRKPLLLNRVHSIWCIENVLLTRAWRIYKIVFLWNWWQKFRRHFRPWEWIEHVIVAVATDQHIHEVATDFVAISGGTSIFVPFAQSVNRPWQKCFSVKISPLVWGAFSRSFALCWIWHREIQNFLAHKADLHWTMLALFLQQKVWVGCTWHPIKSQMWVAVGAVTLQSQIRQHTRG